MRFTPHTADDVRAMLAAIGAGSIDDLVAHVPATVRERAALRLAPGIDEQAVRAEMASLAAANGRPGALDGHGRQSPTDGGAGRP